MIEDDILDGFHQSVRQVITCKLASAFRVNGTNDIVLEESKSEKFPYSMT